MRNIDQADEDPSTPIAPHGRGYGGFEYGGLPVFRHAAVVSGAVKSFFRRWQKRLPSPLTRADLRARYVYELAFRQFEVSDTRVFDRATAGRSFFEQLVGDHLDVGRPESVSLIFDRRINRRPRRLAHQGDHRRG